MKETILKALGAYVGETGGLISGLRAVQERCGFIPPETLGIAADLFNISQAEVRGVISFYADFRTEKRGQNHVRICMAEACQSMGARDLADDVQQRLGVGLDETDKAKDLTIEPVYCLGLCSLAPAAEVNGKLLARVHAEQVAQEVSK